MLIHNNISPHHLVTPVCTVPFPLQYQPQYSPAQQIANHSTKTRLLTTYPFLFLATHSMDHTVLIPMTNLWTYSLSLSYYDHRSTIPCHPRRYRQSHSPPPDNNLYIQYSISAPYYSMPITFIIYYRFPFRNINTLASRPTTRCRSC